MSPRNPPERRGKPSQQQPEKNGELLPKTTLCLGPNRGHSWIKRSPGPHRTIPAEHLYRHFTGDWGDLEDEDKAENELLVEQGFRILGAYKLSDETRVWVIPEVDRSATTLPPEDY